MLNLKKIYSKAILERLTIPVNGDDPIEQDLYKQMRPDYIHGDRIIRWYRLALKKAQKGKTGAAAQQAAQAAAEAFVGNFGNIKDSLQSYDSALELAKTLRLADKEFTGTTLDGKEVKLKPKTFLDQKYLTVEQAESFISQFFNLVNAPDVKSPDYKYNLDNGDLKNIRLLGQNGSVCVWETRTFDSTNKLIFQLWQNAETMDDGSYYGRKAIENHQSPYCTHAKQHWNGSAAAKGWPADEYRQFWYLKKLPNVKYVVGDLTNPGTFATFKALKNTGPETICALNDSNTCWNDAEDSSDQFGNAQLIDKMTVNSGYNFNGEGPAVKELFHSLFDTPSKQLDPNQKFRRFIQEWGTQPNGKYGSSLKLVPLTKIDVAKVYLKSEGVPPSIQKQLDASQLQTDDDLYISELRLSDYVHDKDLDENGKLGFKILPIECPKLLIDINVSSLENCPTPSGFSSELTITSSKLKDLTGLSRQFECNLKLVDCPLLESLRGIPDKLHALKIQNCPNFKSFECPEKFMLDGFDESSLDIDGFYGNSFSGFPKTIYGKTANIQIKSAGPVDISGLQRVYITGKINLIGDALLTLPPIKNEINLESDHRFPSIDFGHCRFNEISALQYYMPIVIDSVGFTYILTYFARKVDKGEKIDMERAKREIGSNMWHDNRIKIIQRDVLPNRKLAHDICQIKDCLDKYCDYKTVVNSKGENDYHLICNFADIVKDFPDISENCLKTAIEVNALREYSTHMIDTPEAIAHKFVEAIKAVRRNISIAI